MFNCHMTTSVQRI